MKPVKIKREADNSISILWSDDIMTMFSLDTLRDECPCAGCKGETILFMKYEPPTVEIDLPGKYDLKSIVPVGNYALQFVWGDGHDTGIYTWEYLRKMPPCKGCNHSGKS